MTPAKHIGVIASLVTALALTFPNPAAGQDEPDFTLDGLLRTGLRLESARYDGVKGFDIYDARLGLSGRVGIVFDYAVRAEYHFVEDAVRLLDARLSLPLRDEILRLDAGLVMAGFGRTGTHWFGIQHWGVEPDIMVMAKGIASGLPLSGILAREDVMAAWKPGVHGGTYGGNVVACAAANATLDVIEDEGLVANARERGAQFLAGLRELGARHRAVGDVRGLGLMLALELVRPDDGDGRVPDADLTKKIQAEALDRKLIVLTAGSYANVVRIIPPPSSVVCPPASDLMCP